jgi:hypothetical protein
MDFLSGVLVTVCFFIALFSFYYVGYWQGKRVTAPTPINKEKQSEIEQFNKGFKAIMNYDVDTALQRKKVTSLE